METKRSAGINSDTGALRQREQINARGARHSLENWILQQVAPSPGTSVLDLGCGTGKQVFVLAKRVAPSGSVLGLDISAAAVEAVNERASSEGLDSVRAIRGELDEALGLVGNTRFDLILSTYAIYYARNMVKLLAELRDVLRPAGIVFVCGPAQGTNQEMADLIEAATGQSPNPVPDFLTATQIEEVGGSYAAVDTMRLPNQVSFDSEDEAMGWWQSHASFVPDASEAVRRGLASRFAADGGFALTKNVLGVRLCA